MDIYEPLDIDEMQISYAWVIQAIKAVLQGKQGKKEVLEQVIEKHPELRNEVNQILLI